MWNKTCKDCGKQFESKYRQTEFCASCKDERRKNRYARHRETDKGKATQERDRKSRKGKARYKRYRSSEKGKSTRQRNDQSEKAKKRRKRYRKSSVYQATQQRYRKRVRSKNAPNRCLTAEYIDWRNTVYERDDYTCQECGAKGGKLNAHHIVRWVDDKSLRYAVKNGITLCVPCHKKKHKKTTS